MAIYYVVAQRNVGINPSLNVVENKWFILKMKNLIKIKMLKKRISLPN